MQLEAQGDPILEPNILWYDQKPMSKGLGSMCEVRKQYSEWSGICFFTSTGENLASMIL